MARIRLGRKVDVNVLIAVKKKSHIAELPETPIGFDVPSEKGH